MSEASRPTAARGFPYIARAGPTRGGRTEWLRDRHPSRTTAPTPGGCRFGCIFQVIVGTHPRPSAHSKPGKALLPNAIMSVGAHPQTRAPTLPRLGSWVRIPSPAPDSININSNLPALRVRSADRFLGWWVHIWVSICGDCRRSPAHISALRRHLGQT